ncbi:DUF699-domain-containing protein [Annulohypoxylon maeteangense]|uniref:DUF699-domain-containing protein n=1 Tax=Annulohypoxylon maeteangense TaxID=1927788 RepID=UPI0020083E19|nr:DUF699-domain-containing protein [Annulohypoxylon maeteangense]KAI0889357.1 DUF699-domain-containing protein [Annulohypoxylon maeteangense]
MSRKAVDSRIPTLIRNGLAEHKRSFFVVVGDHSKDAIVKLHFIMSQADLRQNKSVLWAYKNKLLGFSSHRKKRENKIKKEVSRGIRDANTEDPFELFVSLHDVRYVYYKETDKILGRTFGMCILQDFEALTPNTLARTIETVEGGGLVILLLKGMDSLRQLYTLSMDVHSRYRTEAHHDVVARFNERFLLSLGRCESCLVIDDELNVLPISGGRGVKPLPPIEESKSPEEIELEKIKDSLQDTQPIGSLVKLARTKDQAEALITFVDAISAKTLRNTVSLTAARGRGKSAALGVAIAAAVSYGYSNIFVTSPSPENLGTLFEFVFKAFDALNYQDHTDYSIIQSTNPDFKKAIVRVNIFRNHRQTIQYIRPQDAHVLGQAELVIIDEAAAIPLPLVRKLLGPYTVFMASTISGYEGTGRSLSLKLIKQLKEQAATSVAQDGETRSPRSLKEVTLAEPIRYAKGDAVEKWLNALLCLDVTPSKPKNNIFPDPSQCQLLHINRDTLFSFHPVPERFLRHMVALFVTSHYKNTPDDMQLMSDAPAHELFVLTSSTIQDNGLPEPLCVIQIALEGNISKQSVMAGLDRGQRPAGDLIPWLVSQQFQDDFASLSGARIVRIATHPDCVSMGYGTKALELLIDYYEGKFINLGEDNEPQTKKAANVIPDHMNKDRGLLLEDIKVRDIEKMQPLFSRLSERKPEDLEYVGVSYGLTQPLHKFWSRAAFAPVYLRQTANDLTGEHTCVMLRPLKDDREWLGAFASDFHRRFLALLSYKFREFLCVLALSIDQSATAGAQLDPSNQLPELTKSELDRLLTPFDCKRLESYTRGVLDHHAILDLVPKLADLYFTGPLKPSVKLTGVQRALLLGIGLQRKDVGAICTELSLESSQGLAMFMKIIRKITAHFSSLISSAVEANMPKSDAIGVSRENASGVHDDEAVNDKYAPLEMSLDAELDEAGDEALQELRAKQRELIDSLPLDQYEIEGDAPGWEEAEKQVLRATKEGRSNPVVSVKSKQSKRKAGVTAAEVYEEAFGEKKHKKAKKSRKGGGD